MRAFLIRKMLQISAKEAFEVEIFRSPFCSTFCSTGKGNILLFFAFRGKRKSPDFVWKSGVCSDLLSSKWCHQESNRGHKDFQSFALPTELWHHCFLFAVAKVGIFFESTNFLQIFYQILFGFKKMIYLCTRKTETECSAVGSALRSGRRGRAFESPHSDIVKDKPLNFSGLSHF